MGSVLNLQGCGTALVTPFRQDGSVDYDAYTVLVDRQVAAGVNFLVALATTGETPTLSPEEKVRLLDITRAHSGGLPVVAGVGSNSVPGTLANIDLLSGHGADAWLVVVPFYNKPTQEGQFQYFRTIAAASSLPLILYNVPGRTGANMTAQTCLRIAAACPNVIATKEASGKIEQVEEILAGLAGSAGGSALVGRFCVLSGDDDMTLEMMRCGARGVISVASNVAPSQVAAMTHAALEGRWEDAAALDAALRDLYKACFVESNPIPAKAALSQLGLCTDAMRLPLVPASPSTHELMAQVLKAL